MDSHLLDRQELLFLMCQVLDPRMALGGSLIMATLTHPGCDAIADDGTTSDANEQTSEEDNWVDTVGLLKRLTTVCPLK